jgi:glucose/arabinose dehydrogenase
VSERDRGVISVIEPDGTRREVLRVPSVAFQEGGLLGLAVGPDDGLYAYYTSETDNRVVRADPGSGALTPIVTGIPKAPIHNGGRLAFGPDARLYVATGDAADQPAAQDPGSLAGKILRVERDGSVPADNPFPGSPVYSLGHRNVQGLAWDGDGLMYATEFGPDRDDELNLIEPGGNYGWPEVTGSSGGRFADPLFTLPTSQASPSGLVHVTAPGAWQGSLLFGGLRGQRVWRTTARGAGTPPPEPLFDGSFGRVRDVVQAPDGTIWLLTNNRDGRGQPRPGDDLVVRIRPPA